MKYALFILVVAISGFSYGDIAQDPADMRNAENAKIACEKLGNLCEKEKNGCSPGTTPMINTCLAIRYFQLEVAKERCGNSQYLRCDQRNREYGVKWMHELNLPNINNPKREVAFRECESVGMYEVKSKTLSRFADSVYSVFKYIQNPIEDIGGPYYRDHEQYYKCFVNKLK